VESFCTLDTEGVLKYAGMPFEVGFTKIGNLLSLGTGDATAKGMIQYVEEVIQKAGNDMDKLIIADIEEDNTSSRRAFEVQKFQEQDPSKIQVKYGDTWEDYSTATPDKCVLVSKQVDAKLSDGASDSPDNEELVIEGSGGKGYVENPGSLTAHAKRMAKSFGKGSQLFYNFLSLAMLTSLRTYCDGLDIQYYKKRGHDYAAAPKVEFFTLDGNGRRPVYAWGQHTNPPKAPDENFRDHAGYVMESPITELAAYIEKQWGLDAGFLNHCIVILNETGDQGVPPHSDKHADSQFWNISLGFTRIMEICKSQKGGGGAHVTDLDLLDNSMLYIDRDDNHDYTHAIKHSKDILDGSVRYSIVFRHITERFIPYDEVQAARFRPGGEFFYPYERISTGTS
jgi:hypothetical protein